MANMIERDLVQAVIEAANEADADGRADVERLSLIGVARWLLTCYTCINRSGRGPGRYSTKETTTHEHQRSPL